MEAKNELCNVIEALTELNGAYPTAYMIDYLLGKPSKAIVQNNHQELETFGIGKGDGEEDEEELYTNVIRQAIVVGYLSKTEDGLALTPKGTKFLNTPDSFLLEDEDDDSNQNPENDSEIDSIIQEAELEGSKKSASRGKSALKIKLINAIDRKIPLDDFAIDEGLEFSEVLDELESILHSGTKVHLEYFLEMLLEDDQLDEITGFLDTTPDLNKAILKFENSYDEEVVRLVYICHVVAKNSAKRMNINLK